MPVSVRKPRIPASILAVACLGLAAPLLAAPAALPQEKLHAAYVDGDFEQVEGALRDFEGRRAAYSRDDSVFVAKYLGVIYAASPQTREKGRYYMFRLLDLDPSARLVELFVSEEIDRIFEKVKEEHKARHRTPIRPLRTAAGPDTVPVPPGKSPPQGPGRGQPGSKSSSGWYWAAGGLGLFAAGAATYYYLAIQEEPAEDKIYDIRKP